MLSCLPSETYTVVFLCHSRWPGEPDKTLLVRRRRSRNCEPGLLVHTVCVLLVHTVCVHHYTVFERQTVGTDRYVCEGAEFWVECTVGKRPFDVLNHCVLPLYNVHSASPLLSPTLPQPLPSHFHPFLFFDDNGKLYFKESSVNTVLRFVCSAYYCMDLDAFTHTHRVTHTHTHIALYTVTWTWKW